MKKVNYIIRGLLIPAGLLGLSGVATAVSPPAGCFDDSTAGEALRATPACDISLSAADIKFEPTASPPCYVDSIGQLSLDNSFGFNAPGLDSKTLLAEDGNPLVDAEGNEIGARLCYEDITSKNVSDKDISITDGNYGFEFVVKAIADIFSTPTPESEESVASESVASADSAEKLRGTITIPPKCEFSSVDDGTSSLVGVTVAGSGGAKNDIYKLPFQVDYFCNESGKKITIGDTAKVPAGSSASLLKASSGVEDVPASGSPSCGAIAGGAVANNSRAIVAAHSTSKQSKTLDLCIKLSEDHIAGAYSREYTVTIEE